MLDDVGYNAHNDCCPSYLSDMIQSADTPSRPPRLRSADSSSYVKPRIWTKFGERAFSYSAPAAWNQLPEHTRRLSPRSAFKRKLKAILFSRIAPRSFSSHMYFVMHLFVTVIEKKISWKQLRSVARELIPFWRFESARVDPNYMIWRRPDDRLHFTASA